MPGDARNPISTIRNLGPAMEAAFARVGIEDAETLRRLGTDAAYRRLLEAGTRPHFIAYYVIEMGLQGRPWNDCVGEEKARLRIRFDDIVADVRSSVGKDIEIERQLDRLGIVEPRA